VLVECCVGHCPAFRSKYTEEASLASCSVF
jgi:hypothetical protein